MTCFAFTSQSVWQQNPASTEPTVTQPNIHLNIIIVLFYPVAERKLPSHLLIAVTVPPIANPHNLLPEQQAPSDNCTPARHKQHASRCSDNAFNLCSGSAAPTAVVPSHTRSLRLLPIDATCPVLIAQCSVWLRPCSRFI